MIYIIYLLSIYGLAFALKESSGPWGILAKLRNWLFTRQRLGVFFYELFSCYFCLGFHCGWLIYLISPEPLHFNLLFLWGLAGGIFCLILDAYLNFSVSTKE